MAGIGDKVGAHFFDTAQRREIVESHQDEIRTAGAGLPPHLRSVPVTTHSPDALQLNGSSLPGGEQSCPQTLPEQTFVEDEPLLDRLEPDVSDGDATRPEQAMPSSASERARKDSGPKEERGEALMMRVNVGSTALPFASREKNSGRR